jgi:hypothetical protein
VVVSREWALNEVPLFVRTGAVVPMRPANGLASAEASTSLREPLVWGLFPGAFDVTAQGEGIVDGAGIVYDDAGDGMQYETSLGELTSLSFSSFVHGDGQMHVDVTIRVLVDDDVADMGAGPRNHTLQLRGLELDAARAPAVTITGGVSGATWHVAEDERTYLTEPPGTLIVDLGPLSLGSSAAVVSITIA